MDKVVIPQMDFEPFCILEGGRGLNDDERSLATYLNDRNVDNWVIQANSWP